MPMRFQDKDCLVTDGGSGIGRAACQRFTQEGGKVVVVDLNEEHGNETVQHITTCGGEAIFTRADMPSKTEVVTTIDTAVSKWGGIDVLVNDAAMMTFTPIVDLPDGDWDRAQAVNMRSVFLFCKYALPHMQGGAIVNVSSVHAHETTANVVPYASSKGAMEACVRGLSREVDAKQARINAVAPGAVDTPMLWSTLNVKSGKEKVQGAIGKPEELAAAIAFLASSDASYINGTTLVVDGGRLDIL